MASVVSIIIHPIALACFGFVLWSQWLASLLGIIMGSVVLCHFTKCAYITAGILFLLGALCDIQSTIAWVAFYTALDEFNEDYLLDDNVESDSGGGFGFLAFPPAIGAVSLVVGAIAAFTSVCKWKTSGAPGMIMVHSGGINVGAGQAPLQDHYPQAVAKEAPPGYAGNV